MIYTKIIRIKDNKVFYIGEENGYKFICGGNSKFPFKFLSLVKDFNNRFIIGVDNGITNI